ncbi:MAG: four helix bundle protein [Gemmatimonadetes bacterium]|nr:four helix bundle protein [Gemmatimonadota bacterium]NIO32896.1 four helix bundle protein [Gemmatimonadota bacterium]
MGKVDGELINELQDRLIGMAAKSYRIANNLPASRVAAHVSSQLNRCSTSPAADYAEARGSESRKDFIHKMKVCLKELRETFVWLKLAKELELGSGPELDEAIAEADELIGIFVTSIATAKRNAKQLKL